MRIQATSNAFGIAARTSPDVGHPNAAAAALEMLVFGEIPAKQLIVDVAVNHHQRGHLGQGVGDPEVPDVSGVPDLIAPFQMMEDAVVDVTVGVADQSNAHGAKLRMDARTAPSWRCDSRG